ncbi:MAG: metalloprotease, partial [Chlamydiae bacterium]|nr:metalloprotease [Chlamydiota bacterium]
REELEKILFQTLHEIASKPLPKDQIEAALHQLEFERMEIDNSEGPFGLTLFMKAALISQHGAEPENALLIHTLFHELKEKLEDLDFLPRLIQKYFLKNPHFVRLSLVPDHELEQKEAEEEKKRLETIREKLSSQDEIKIVQEAEKLIAYQESIEQQSLECLPKLSLKDVSPHIRDLSLTENKIGNLSVFHHACFSNKILYADLLFDLPHIPLSDLPFVSLLTRFWTEVGCGGKSYAQTLQDIQATTGGISATVSLHPLQEDSNRIRPSIALKGKALARNRHHLFRLFKNLVKSPNFTDKERLKELLLQHATALQNRFTKSALSYAMQTALSGFSTASFIFNEWNGLPYYATVLKWAKNPELLFKELPRIQEMILGKGSPHLVLSCDEEEFNTLQKDKFYSLADDLPNGPLDPWRGKYPLPDVESQARFLAIPVAFTTWAMRTIGYQDSDSPLLLLSTELLKNVVLHGEVREKGGAYGAEAAYSPSIGNFYLYSYRDPNLAKTMHSFQKAFDTIAAGKFNEDQLEEAKFGILQTLDAPIAPSDRAMTAYSWKRAGRTTPLREAFRKKVFTATRKEIAEAVTKHLLSQKKVLISFCSEALYEKEKKKLPFPLEILPIPTP